jgi:SapC
MVNIVPVDRARHAGKGWRHPTGYGFAKKDAVVAIVASEFARAALALPIGFVEGVEECLPGDAALGFAHGEMVSRSSCSSPSAGDEL